MTRSAAYVPLLLGLLACSGRLDLGHDRGRAVSTLAPDARTPALCDGVPCFAGDIIDLGASTGNAMGLVVDDRNAYWAAASVPALMITPRDGGLTDEIKTPDGGPYRVDANETTLYFTSRVGGYVASTPKPPPRSYGPKLPPDITTLVSGEPEPESLLVAAEGVYYADQVTGTLNRVGLTRSEPVTIASGIYSGCELALGEQFLYYVDGGLGELHAVDRATGANTLLASDLENPAAPVVRGQDLYFLELGTVEADYADGRLLRMPITGGTPQVLVDQLDAPRGLAADAGGVYLCTRGNNENGYRGRIVRRGDDGQIATLATAQAQPFAIAVDSLAVYWTADGDSCLHSIRR